MNEIGCLDDSGAAPQALDILAGLAFLGISKTLRDEVQRALSDITQASGVTEYPHLQTNVGSIPSLRFGKATDKTTSPLTTGSDRESALQRKVAELDQKMGMSRSIMKKLYHKNVELEKELAIVKVYHHINVNYHNIQYNSNPSWLKWSMRAYDLFTFNGGRSVLRF